MRVSAPLRVSAQLVIAFVISAVIEPLPMPLPPKKAN
jgi:hypothetical protein